MRFLGEQRRRAHDLSGLTEAALRYTEIEPRLLAWVERTAVVGQSLDGGDLRQRGHADVDGAGTHRLAVHVHRTRAALGHAAAELRSLQAEDVADGPEER